jgi:lauroyl/myristoyl acyltransferase
VRTKYLLNSLGSRLRLLDLGRPQRARSLSWLTIQGLDYFEEASRRGPVVLLSSHFGTARVAPVLLARRGCHLLSLEAWGKEYAGLDPAVAARIEVHVMRGRNAFPARSTLAARRCLSAGGIVHTTGDGRLGRADMVVPFCGRLYEFRSTFAAMAVDAGATVIPVFAPVDELGRVHLQFLGALDQGPPAAPRDVRIQALVRQYVRELERRWLTDPGNVHRFLWEDHVAAPAVEA